MERVRSCGQHTFLRSVSASEDSRGILSCASLTRTLRATSEDMALMIRVLHCSAVAANVLKGVPVSGQHDRISDVNTTRLGWLRG